MVEATKLYQKRIKKANEIKGFWLVDGFGKDAIMKL